MSYDAEIGVVGAGPAGARAAELLAKQGADVLLLDPRTPWEKPCGGGLTASVFRSVPDLVEVTALAQRIDRVRLEASADVLVDVPLDVPLYVIARVILSRWQLDRATAAGATFESTAVKRVERMREGWKLHLGNGSSRQVRRVIGADGAASTVRKAVAPDLRIELEPTRVVFAHGAGSFHALRPFYPEIGSDDFALLGDAAGFADPATGEGIQNALRSGAMISEAYAHDGTFSAYPRIAFEAFEPEFRIARTVRRVLYAWDLPVRLIDVARTRNTVYALLAAIVRGGNIHDPRLWRSWLREMRHVVGDRNARAESNRVRKTP